jgi:hypothetical protein
MTITVRPGDPPPSCQHYRIDNETCRCVECDERMVVQRVEYESVLDAPNAAACTNPACLAALNESTYDETDPPAGCTNPHGMYLPDQSRERRVVIGAQYLYECERCPNSGTIYDHRGVTWDCGHSHRGDRVAIDDSSALPYN